MDEGEAAEQAETSTGEEIEAAESIREEKEEEEEEEEEERDGNEDGDGFPSTDDCTGVQSGKKLHPLSSGQLTRCSAAPI